MKPAKPRKSKIVKKKLTAAEKAARRVLAKKKRDETKFRTSAKDIFMKAGFTFIVSENKEFSFDTEQGSRTTELDGVFVYENVLVVMEDTCTASPGGHLSKKNIIFDLALKNKKSFVDCLRKNLEGFESYFNAHRYESADYELRIVYFSMHSVDTEYVDSATRIGVQVVERALANYFYALVKNISVSAKYELLKFLKVDYSDVGKAKISGGSSAELSSF